MLLLAPISLIDWIVKLLPEICMSICLLQIKILSYQYKCHYLDGPTELEALRLRAKPPLILVHHQHQVSSSCLICSFDWFQCLWTPWFIRWSTYCHVSSFLRFSLFLCLSYIPPLMVTKEEQTEILHTSAAFDLLTYPNKPINSNHLFSFFCQYIILKFLLINILGFL